MPPLPYPHPSGPEVSKRMRANPRRDTKPEIALRSLLHHQGLRFRKDLLIRAGDVRTHPDIVFTKAKVAVFVDGCFWHMCPEHCHVPKSNPDYWIPKLNANVARDARVTAALEAHGWTVIRVWEHEDTDALAKITRAPARIRPLTHPNVEIRIAPAIT